MNAFALFAAPFATILYVAFMAIWIYLVYLLVKLMRRGIRALDIYIRTHDTEGRNSQ